MRRRNSNWLDRRSRFEHACGLGRRRDGRTDPDRDA
jgi:hypothetical protein